VGNRINCKKCGVWKKSLTKSKEANLCLDCYMEKYGEYPKSFIGHAPPIK